MPPRFYPKLRTEDGSVHGRVRKGYLTLDQLGRAINGTEELEQRTALKVIYYCALRASELGLQPIEHFDRRRGTLQILRLKGSHGHTYKLTPWVLRDVLAWLDERPESPYLFPHRKDPSSPLDRFSVFRFWHAAATRAKLDIEAHGHPHVLKHSVATHMLERGDDQRFVQEWLGHKDAASTQVYAEVVGKRLKEGQQVMEALTEELDGQT
jgi:integrase